MFLFIIRYDEDSEEEVLLLDKEDAKKKVLWLLENNIDHTMINVDFLKNWFK